MEDMVKLLKEHFDNHPDMEIRDAVKFLYQNRMGVGHLIGDEATALTHLETGWAQVKADPSIPLTEPLGGGMYRLQLSACKGTGLSIQTVFRLFLLTAQQAAPDRSGLERDLELVYDLPFPRAAAEAELAQFKAQGCPAVSHSARYRAAYAPAYRVISQKLARLLPLLCAIDQEISCNPFVRVAIDGPCASGKSTLGEELSQIYSCPLIHMDDFFLRPEQRTEERLSQPGGNVDYERFLQEVLLPLTRQETACYRPWRCRMGGFDAPVTLPPCPLVVVEGSYSLRPDLRDHYQLRVWVEAPMEERLGRLAQRGGPGCLERFRTMWIPLENRYFDSCRVKECCQLFISGSKSQ